MPKATLLLAAAATIGAGLWAGATGGTQLAGGRHAEAPVFAEEFRGGELRASRWNTCHWWARHGCTLQGNRELEWYLPGQVRVGGGVVRLVAERRPARGAGGRVFPFRSGMISTGPPRGSSRPKFAFRYGRVEMRARVPAGRGLWSAFWLLPADRDSKPEIDVMEVLGHRPSVVEMHLHPRRGADPLGREWRQPGLSRGWHTFGIEWRPGVLEWLLDGRVRWRVTGRDVPAERMYLVANLAVGGDWPGAPSSSTRFPSALVIDWIRVWR